ncbi:MULTISPECIES: histidine triad nucleotide-binding protein [Nitrosomonas]|uniref:HIT family hydrolase n=1 Tax=Nitrosomonas communis TaxID=44574 RepID=A0A0F7KJR0_9PROT|nr:MULTISPECIES: histidine triad nucleotide-binding protein [Nitrosomonas]AKH39189.1 HIT family hydrolase [Nitrosomonas communis]TYP80007.1 histidine triad (HIT) family protein [Nitrosomonas communis]UVS61376.1 histidine triad nucleotide-binding protein [Nitrosomonas sp. PLL12]
MEECIFCKIVQGEIPANKVFEDQDFVAFHDIHPAAPVHFLLIPKRHISSLYDVSEADQPLLGKMLWLIPQLAKEQGCVNGFRTIINTGRVGGQEVLHLHIHIIAGKDRLPTMIHHG